MFEHEVREFNVSLFRVNLYYSYSYQSYHSHTYSHINPLLKCAHTMNSFKHPSFKHRYERYELQAGRLDLGTRTRKEILSTKQETNLCRTLRSSGFFDTQENGRTVLWKSQTRKEDDSRAAAHSKRRSIKSFLIRFDLFTSGPAHIQRNPFTDGVRFHPERFRGTRYGRNDRGGST